MKSKLAISLCVSAVVLLCFVVTQAVQADIKSKDMSGRTVPVTERFQSYNGVRNLSSLENLFINPHPAGITQLPKIAVSDGVSSVVIELRFSEESALATNFACNGARLVSITRPVPDKWLVTLLPDKGSWKSSLIILNETNVREVPLVVTPPLPAEIIPDEKLLFVSGKDGTFGAIIRDLNSDGKLDYLDDYIFMANYLLRKLPVAVAGESIKGEAASKLTVYPLKQSPGAGPGIDPNSGAGIKPVFDAERHSPASRNERARKMKEQLRQDFSR